MTRIPLTESGREEATKYLKFAQAKGIGQNEMRIKMTEILMRNNPNSKKAFDVLNTRDTVIVSDTSNDCFLEAGCPKAHKTYIDQDYCGKFVETVMETLGRVL
jgi:hypothetical protein